MNTLFEKGTFHLGVNYWESVHATEMWRKWDPETVEKDFAVLEEYGIEWVRCFPWWRDFQPVKFFRTPSRQIMEIRFLDETKLPDTPAGQAGVSESMMEHFEEFCGIAERHRIRLIVCIMTGQMTFGLFTPEAFADMDLYTDPRALKWEGRFIRYFVERTRNQRAIAAWESGNESRCLGPVQYAETAAVWMNYIHHIIRLADPTRPVIGINDPDLPGSGGKWLVADMAECSDALSVHPYPMFDHAKIDPYAEIRNGLDAALQNQVVEDVSGKLSFIEETGVRRATTAEPETEGRAVRSILWNSFAAGAHAYLWWCAFDQSHLETAPYDWPQPTLELGMFKEDRTALLTARVFRDFSRFLKQLPFRVLPEQKKEAFCITGDKELAKAAGILCRQNQVPLNFLLPGQPLPEGSAVFLMPSVRGRNGLTVGAWNALKEKVRKGATLYLSLNDCFLTDLEEVCGCAITAYSEPGGTGRYRFRDFEVTLPRPALRRMKSSGAEVLASDADGNPVFFRYSYGKGTVYTCAFELEAIAASRSGIFGTDLCKVYSVLFGKREKIVSAGLPNLLISEHPFDAEHCAVILSNSSEKTVNTELAIRDGWRISGQFSDTAEAALSGKHLHMSGNTGLLLMMDQVKE